MRFALLLLVGTVSLCGCAACHQECADRLGEQALEQPAPMQVAALPARRFASGLIFDRRPGLYSASNFAWRSDWPSADAYYQSPELILYSEHFYDVQGPGYPCDNTYRQFDTYRFGAGVR